MCATRSRSRARRGMRGIEVLCRMGRALAKPIAYCPADMMGFAALYPSYTVSLNAEAKMAMQSKQLVVCISNDGYSASLEKAENLPRAARCCGRKTWAAADRRRIWRGLSLPKGIIPLDRPAKLNQESSIGSSLVALDGCACRVQYRKCLRRSLIQASASATATASKSCGVARASSTHSRSSGPPLMTSMASLPCSYS